MMRFEYEDSGKTAYIAVQVENDGKKDPGAACFGRHPVTKVSPAQAVHIQISLTGKTVRAHGAQRSFS
jgi:hypothetical protein